MISIKIKEAAISFEDFSYRAPMKFRASVVDRVTLLNVNVRVEANDGRQASGFGSMTLGNVWSFPSATLSYDQTLEAMKQLAIKFGSITESHKDAGDPLELNHHLEPQYLDAARSMPVENTPIPPLCTLVVASAFDAAIHDAFGKILKTNCYWAYGPDHIAHDLSRYLDSRFKGEYLNRYLSTEPRASLHIYHLVGALDPLIDSDLKTRIGDGLPETLEEWVRADGVDHIKIKLDGANLDWDVDRVLSVNAVLSGLEQRRDWHYSLDFNERCQDAEYVVDCFARIRKGSRQAFSRIEYVEQPTNRNLDLPGTADMHQAGKIKPVVIDESLVDYQSLLRARELGYSGVALKACKGQTNALLMAAAAQKFGMFTCVQDLTCPGASLLESVGLAAHIPPITAVESNARQYVPAANAPWTEKFPGIFRPQNGMFRTEGMGGPGLGIVE
ncbi:MAG TPA: enolase C-terminal domain-like protein [Bryobacteraceae bacterium]|jgi:L-alanine-DL-glutamate epimerase-like enolase superfamily enzyme|nr:enolase C-terminal domain-like protein [Bryobacteraceae bacterium]